MTGHLMFHHGQLVLVGPTFRNFAAVTVLESLTGRLARLDDLRPIGGAR